jgi:hypothetical protein
LIRDNPSNFRSGRGCVTGRRRRRRGRSGPVRQAP